MTWRPRKTKVPLIPLCHQFVHSYVFSCAFDENRAFGSVLVSSDRERNRMLFSVLVPEVMRVFRAVGMNYPNSYRSEFNEAKGGYDVVIKTESAAKSRSVDERNAICHPMPHALVT